MVEDIIYNLVHGIDEVAINKQVEEYKHENMDAIIKYESKKIEEERKIVTAIKQEREHMMTEAAKYLVRIVYIYMAFNVSYYIC